MADDSELQEAIGQLVDQEAPWLIGVRHHSTALSRAIPSLLDRMQPRAILLEMAPDYERWIECLGRDDLQAPVALSASSGTQLLSFYPLADFSPELVAIRWAATQGVPVLPCDLDLSTMAVADALAAEQGRGDSADDDAPTSWLDRLQHQHETRHSGELWDVLVETPAIDSDPEAVRRAALMYGWMVRQSAGGPTFADAHREAAMRAAIASAPKRSVAIVGSFHAAALLTAPLLWSSPESITRAQRELHEIASPSTALISYSFEQLDWRSGYPAGVTDPVWHQTMLTASTPSGVERRVSRLAVDLCRELRQEGQIAGTTEAIEIVRLTRDLSRLRGVPAAGRRELLEAVETSLVQGDLFGRGRAVARAAHAVLVGEVRGRLPKGTPRSGVGVEIEQVVARLRLPGPESIDEEPRDVRLDPLRSRLDRARAVVLRRLNLVGVSYAERLDSHTTGRREHLTEHWRVQWTHTTSATVEAAGVHGATLLQACEAAVLRLRHDHAACADAEFAGDLHPASTLIRLHSAAECGLHSILQAVLPSVQGSFLQAATLSSLVDAACLLQKIGAGHVAGLPMRREDEALPDVSLLELSNALLSLRPLVDAALRSVHALRGSDDVKDAAAIVELAAMVHSEGEPRSDGADLSVLLPPLRSQLRRLQREASPMLQGVAFGTLALLGDVDVDRLGVAEAGWYDAASSSEGRRQLRTRLAGLLVALMPLASNDPEWLQGFHQRFSSSPDGEFLARLPALRGGFESLNAADRARLLRDRLALIEPHGPGPTGARRQIDPKDLHEGTLVDRFGRAAIVALLPDLALRDPERTDAFSPAAPIRQPPGELSLADRWRLVLGVRGCEHPQARAVASTLDQLYGSSERLGRGRQEDLAREAPSVGGTGEASPSTREWVQDVEGIFGKDVCEEVVAEAAASGRVTALEHLNPETVNPSVGLLEQVLSLRGALPERDLQLLRRLARAITEKLAQQLANRLRPALSGLSTTRPTRRRSPRLHFARTLQRNLDTAYRRDDGSIAIAPRQPVFRAPAKRQMDWHLIFVVDVSGSMEPSVIYSALTAAIFSSLPAIEVKFYVFSTSVIELTDAVDDPLSLLMEVNVGGGTYIGLGLRAAREAVRNPSRTLVVLVSDFEEGVSVPEMLAEVKALSDSGCKLIGLAALDDQAKPRYHAGTAAAVAGVGMPVAAVSPERLAEWVGDQIRGGR